MPVPHVRNRVINLAETRCFTDTGSAPATFANPEFLSASKTNVSESPIEARGRSTMTATAYQSRCTGDIGISVPPVRYSCSARAILPQRADINAITVITKDDTVTKKNVARIFLRHMRSFMIKPFIISYLLAEAT